MSLLSADSRVPVRRQSGPCCQRTVGSLPKDSRVPAVREQLGPCCQRTAGSRQRKLWSPSKYSRVPARGQSGPRPRIVGSLLSASSWVPDRRQLGPCCQRTVGSLLSEGSRVTAVSGQSGPCQWIVGSLSEDGQVPVSGQSGPCRLRN